MKGNSMSNLTVKKNVKYLSKLEELSALYDSIIDTYKFIGKEITELEKDQQACRKACYDFQYSYERIITGEEPLKIGIVGSFNTGKSTLINSLIGEDLLGTDVLPATTGISILKYGDEKKFAIIRDNGIPKHITYEEYKKLSNHQYAEEMDLEHNQSNHRHFEIHYPFEILRCYNIIDTPGFSSMSPADDELTRKWIGNIDFILWVFDANKGTIDNEELKLLKSIKGKDICAVVNRLDNVEESRRKRLVDSFASEHNFNIIIWYAAKPILDHTLSLKKRTNAFRNTLNKIQSYIDNSGEIDICCRRDKIFAFDKEQNKEVCAFALQHVDKADYLDYSKQFHNYLTGLKKEIEPLKHGILENQVAKFICEHRDRLESVKYDLEKIKEANNKLINNDDAVRETMKNLVERLETRYENLRVTLFEEVHDLIFTYNIENGGWFSNKKYTIQSKDPNEQKLISILETKFNHFLKDVIGYYSNCLSSLGLPQEQNDLSFLEELEYLIGLFVEVSCMGVFGLSYMWSVRDLQDDCVTNSEEKFNSMKIFVEGCTESTIADVQIFKIIFAALESDFNEKVERLENKLSTQNNKINMLINSINSL